MKIFVITVLSILIVALFACVMQARRTEKKIARSVSMLLTTIIPPIAGKILVIGAADPATAYVGYYMFCVGMDLLMIFLIRFVVEYCFLKFDNRLVPSIIDFIFTLNIIQIMLNLRFGHAFELRLKALDKAAYYTLDPKWGYMLHTAIIFGFFFIILGILIAKTLRSAHLYRERYVILFIALAVTGVWETFYILSGHPLDTSMIGFAISGLLIFYFSIIYKPVHLLSGMLENIASGLSEALFFFDEGKTCIWANDQGMKLLGISEDNLDFVTHSLLSLFPNMQEIGSDWCVLQVNGEGKDRKYFNLESHVARERGHNNRIVGSFLSVFDSTESHVKLEKERYLARHDSLTGLYNKDYLFARIRQMLDEYPDEKFQVAFVDVNEFKMVNDVYGKEFGDYVLKKIGEWISQDMPEKCLYGRLGGDTFGVFQPVEQFKPERINKVLDNFVVRQGDKEHKILMHVGVYEIDDPQTDVSVMFDRAHMALGTIKRLYAHIAYYTDEIKENMLWNQKISSEITDAIADGQIKPYLQPIVNANGKVVGAEVLARWQHPDRGLLPPALFIPEFEKNGKIVEIDRFMWRCACELLRDKSAANPDFFLSVNISPMDFYFLDIPKEIRSLVEEYGIDPVNLKLEITEEVMTASIEKRRDVINQLRANGHMVAMDDFGSGYSSLNMLKDTPADVVKVDMAFLRDVARGDRKAHTILRSVIEMIDTLGLTSLTEGVETEEQFEDLAEMGCMLFQGYHFAKPLPLDEFEKFYDENRSA